MDINEKTSAEHISSSDELSHISKSLDKISYFDDWTVEMKKECAKFSRIKNFTKEQIIFENDSNTNQYVHFIMEGKAKVIQIIESKMNEENENDVLFMEVFQFSKLSCFNIGEDLHERIIVAGDDTECLLIPGFWLLEINKKLWHRMRFFFNRNIPTKSEAEKRFFKRIKFSEYRKNLVEKIHERSRKSLYNYVFNVPLTLRLNQKE